MLTVLLLLLLTGLTPAEIAGKADSLYAAGQFREAADLVDEALPEVRESDDEESLADCLFVLSKAYFRLGAFPQAFEAQEECYRIDLASGDAAHISSSLNSLAAICLAMEDYAQAETLIRDAIRYEETLGETAALAVRYGMASDILLKAGKVDEAVRYAEQALRMDREAGRTYQTAVRESQLASVYMDTERLDEAWKLLEAASPVFEAEGNLHSLSVCRLQQGTIAARRKGLPPAAPYLQEALVLSRKTGNLLVQKNVLSELALVLKETDPQAAVGYMQEAAALTDSLYRQELARKLSEFNLQYDLAGKEQEIALQRQQLRSRRIGMGLLAGLAVLLAAVIALLILMLSAREKNNRMLRKASDLKDQLLALGLPSQPEQAQDIHRLAQELSDMGAPPEKQLTAREREIARLCSEGLINKEIADRLHISQRTVEAHKNNIFRKLGISTTIELVRLMGQREGR